MKAIVLLKPGSTDNLAIQEVSVPEIGPGEVLIKVKAISINPVDVKTRAGKGIYDRVYNGSELIIGWDVSGEITGSKSNIFKVGDEVFGLVNFPGIGNAYSEYVAAPETHLALKPQNITHAEAAAATLAPLTALQVFRDKGAIKRGDRVLVHAASGGVGHYAVQIAKQLGAYVIGSSSAANRDFVLSLGADEHIDYKTQTLQEATGNIDFVLDGLGVESILKSIDVTKEGGKIISIISYSNTAEVIAKAEQKHVITDTYFVHSDGADMKILANWLQSGVIKSHVSQKYKFEQMAEAHQQIESGRTIGKIVVTI
jgi:NADPH:quinone reductase-like Zn-dependent oxidoreductase